jgi:hypothetical protein
VYVPLSNAQSKQYLDAASAFDGFRQVEEQLSNYRGGMHWKRVSGADYLYRTHDRRGNAKSLGVRSAETERIHAEFTRRKASLAERQAELKATMLTQFRVNAALRLGTVPNEVADVCEALEQSGLMGKGLTVIGTNAMHAYGFLGGVRFDADIMATTDVDLLWDHKAKLSLASTSELSESGLIGILQRADKTYEQDSKQRFRARASSGFMVDLIRQMPQPPWAEEADRFFDNDLVATDIANMKWLLSAPRISQPVVAVNGRVFTMVAPDPRAYAAYKLWLSQQSDRDPLKKGRDLAQAKALIHLIGERLPHLGHWGAFKSIPRTIMDAAWAPPAPADEPTSLTPGPVKRGRAV